MMKLACCLPGGSFMPEGVKEVPTTPYESLMMKGCAIMDLGYDGVEVTAGLLLQLTEEECDRFLAENKFPLIAANSFIPPQYPIIGVDEEGKKAVYDYADSVIRRLSYLHSPYIVFGSGGARRIPDGYDPAKAEAELDAFLAHCNETCAKYGVTVVIEPLRATEANFINTVADGAAVVNRVNLPHIRLLADGFHMGFNGENFEDVCTYRDIILHTHIASTPSRKNPGFEGGKEETEFLKCLHKAGYDSYVTVECSFSNFHPEAETAIRFLKEVLPTL